MPSLYAQYVNEREGKEIVEDNNGFATFKFIQDYCYVEDVYVVPAKRKSGICLGYINAIAEIALRNGYTKLLTSVSPKANGAEASLKSTMACGFKVLSCDKDLIYFVKELEISNG